MLRLSGVVSVLLHVAPHQFPGLCYVAIAFYALNVFLFLAFLGISVARYTIYPCEGLFPHLCLPFAFSGCGCAGSG